MGGIPVANWIYKRNQGAFKIQNNREQHQLVVRTELEPGNSGFQEITPIYCYGLVNTKTEQQNLTSQFMHMHLRAKKLCATNPL